MRSPDIEEIKFLRTFVCVSPSLETLYVCLIRKVQVVRAPYSIVGVPPSNVLASEGLFLDERLEWRELREQSCQQSLWIRRQV